MSLHVQCVKPVLGRLPGAAGLALLWWALAACSPTTVSADTPRSAFAGTWQVRQVLIDERRTDRLLYQIDDPRLVGRTVAIGARQVQANLPEAAGCEQPGLEPVRMALNTLLIRTVLPDPPALPPSDAARLFDARLPGERPVDMAWITCKPGSFGPVLKGVSSAAPGGTWLALLPPGQALMPWYGHTLLVLQRPPLDAPITPSFACAKARLPAEKAICASPALASYDRSVAKGWAYTMQFCDGDADCIATARQDQKQWVAQRNRCGADQVCLQNAMRERLDVLMAPAAD